MFLEELGFVGWPRIAEEAIVARDIQLNSVLFPAPFGPIKEHIEDSATLNEESLTATIPPNLFVTFLIDIIF